MKNQHYETLNGLSGVVAVAVFAFHMTELIFHPASAKPAAQTALRQANASTLATLRSEG